MNVSRVSGLQARFCGWKTVVNGSITKTFDSEGRLRLFRFTETDLPSANGRKFIDSFSRIFDENGKEIMTNKILSASVYTLVQKAKIFSGKVINIVDMVNGQVLKDGMRLNF